MTTKGYWQNWYGQIKTGDKVLIKITPECPYPSFFEEGSILLATVTWVCKAYSETSKIAIAWRKENMK